jgi:N4-(beta-N-acetylglucosaminyl)-L-asparaginase
MKTRRDFIKTAAVAGVGLAFTGVKAESSLGFPTKINKPIVVSTWRFGIEANAAAWEVLKLNGRALDAVEAGVKIPEGDPTERSVAMEDDQIEMVELLWMPALWMNNQT